MVYRFILPNWAKDKFPDRPRVVEGEFTDDEIIYYNSLSYNIYYLPNHPNIYDPSKTVDGSDIDTFNYVFVDMDLKEGKYSSKEHFIDTLHSKGIVPSFIMDSGNGIHAYWAVSDLDAMSYLKLSRRMMRFLNTDEAVGQIFQLMRLPNTYNTKLENDSKLCQLIRANDVEYTCEQLDALLPPISMADDQYCQHHFNKTYSKELQLQIDDKIPLRFAQLLRDNKEVKDIWTGSSDDRSKGDYRLAHILFGNGFTKEEALSTLVNTAKALGRSAVHRVSYATNIVDKIWTYEIEAKDNSLNLSNTVAEILLKHGDGIKGTRLPCWRYLDDTHHGMRLGHVVGLVAGSGVGKTTMALNMFLGFVQNNPDLDHVFVPLEQPANEIAERWRTICGDNTTLHGKVHIISNYDDNGSFRHLSFDEIKDYILKLQQVTKRKMGCIVIDHIGALKKKGKDGENQDLMTICHSMKAFAIQTNTLLIMQSQAPREKAGIGDLEINKDAAYGTVYFESYCDFLITLWQPVKRCYREGAPTVMAFKFCKIRHKKRGLDKIEEDVRYSLYFDPITERLRELTQDEEKSLEFFNHQAVNIRKQDRKTEVLSYVSAKWEGNDDGDTQDNKKPIRVGSTSGIS